MRLPLPPARVRWGVAAVAVVAVLGAAALPGGPMGSVLGVRVDWWLHALAGAGVASALAFALDGPRGPALVLGGALLGALAVGGAAELLQLAVAGRTAGTGDLLAHAAGAVAAVAAWRLGHKIVVFDQK